MLFQKAETYKLTKSCVLFSKQKCLDKWWNYDQSTMSQRQYETGNPVCILWFLDNSSSHEEFIENSLTKIKLITLPKNTAREWGHLKLALFKYLNQNIAGCSWSM